MEEFVYVFIAALLCVLLGVLLLCQGNRMIHYSDSRIRASMGEMVSFAGLMILIMALITPLFYMYTVSTEKTNLESAYNENYNFYLDGTEVNKDYIDINLYEISINEEEKCVYLTRK